MTEGLIRLLWSRRFGDRGLLSWTNFGTRGRLVNLCGAAERRAKVDLNINEMFKQDNLSPSLSRLILGRAALCRAGMASFRLMARRPLKRQKIHIAAALDGFRASGQEWLGLGLLARRYGAFFWKATLPRSARLGRSMGPCRTRPNALHMADIHLHRARLFFREQPYPWKSPQADLAAAEKLIHDCDYHRRDEELTDAKRRPSVRKNE